MSDNNQTWTAQIALFSAAIGLTPDQVTEALKGLVGEPGDDALALLASDEYTPFTDIRAALPATVPTGKLKKAVADHLRAKAAVEPAPAPAPTITSASNFDSLPSVMDDDAWLAALKAGGELRVDHTTVISAIRAALASRVGLFELPDLLVKRMESHAEELEEPVGSDFYTLRKLLTKRSYADIFAALDVEGAFVTQKRKTELLAKLDSTLWPALFSFHSQLKLWTEEWQRGSSNPQAMFAAIAAMASGAHAVLPPGMMQPPATDGLRDSAEGVIAQMNKVFAGTGIPVARALAYDALQIKLVLDNPALPAQLGLPTREQMLKSLGVAVSSDYVRLERNVTRYALAVMEYLKLSAGDGEYAYLGSLMVLGGQIGWDKLGTPSGRSGGTLRDGSPANWGNTPR